MSLKRPHRLPVRYTADELALIRTKAADAGWSVSRFVRETSLGAEVKQRRQHPLADIIYHLSRIGNNINQLAAVANLEARLSREQELDAALAEVLAVVQALDTLPGVMRPSMLGDVLCGGPTEIDVVSGTVSRLGHEHGVDTPLHDLATFVLSGRMPSQASLALPSAPDLHR